LINFEELKSKRAITVLSSRIAESLVYKFGIQCLKAVEPSNKNTRKQVYVFHNFPALYDEYVMLIQNYTINVNAEVQIQEAQDENYV
jgi:hypothetical protein